MSLVMSLHDCVMSLAMSLHVCLTYSILRNESLHVCRRVVPDYYQLWAQVVSFYRALAAAPGANDEAAQVPPDGNEQHDAYPPPPPPDDSPR